MRRRRSAAGLVAVVSETGSISVWDARSGRVRAVVGEGPTAPWGVRFSPDGRILAAAHPGGVIRVWDASNGASLCEYRVEGTDLGALRFSPDGSSILSWYAETMSTVQAHVWDARSGTTRAVFSQHARPIMVGDFLPGGDEVGSMSLDGVVHVWNARTGTSRLKKAFPVELGAPWAHAGRDAR